MFTAELLEIKNVCEKTFCFLFICKQTVELFFGIWMLLVSFWLCWSLIAVSSLDTSTPTRIKCFSLSHKVSHFHAQCWPVPTGSAELSMIPAETATDGTEQPQRTKRENQNRGVTRYKNIWMKSYCGRALVSQQQPWKCLIDILA